MERAIVILMIILAQSLWANHDFLNFLKNDLVLTPNETLVSFNKSQVDNWYKLISIKPKEKQSLRQRHIALNIEFYKKENFSLLLKSIKKFQKLYGANQNQGLHIFFQIGILEKRIKEDRGKSLQIIRLAQKGLLKEKQDENLKMAFYKVILKEQLKLKNFKAFNKEAKLFEAKLRDYQMYEELIWLNKLQVEVALNYNQKLPVFNKRLPRVYADDYKLYEAIKNNNFPLIKEKFITSDWQHYTKSLLNNLIFSSLFLKNKKIALKDINLYSIHFGESDSYKIFKLLYSSSYLKKILNDPFKNDRFNVIVKIISFKEGGDINFTEQEKRLVTDNLKLYIWKYRLERLAINEQKELFLDYITYIPVYRLNLKELSFVFGETKNYLLSLYQSLLDRKKFKTLYSHWAKMMIKSQSFDFWGQEVLLQVGIALINLKKEREYIDFVHYLDRNYYNFLQAYHFYLKKDWNNVIKFGEKTDNINAIALMAMASEQLQKTKKSYTLFEKVFTSKKSILKILRESFYLSYIRQIDSSNTPEKIYQRLVHIKSSIKDHGVSMNRVEEYIDAKLIGLNMTLKNASLEEILKKTDFYLKKYPLGKFCSMIKLTKGKILAQLKKIAKSTEALEQVIKETSSKQIKTQALDELSVLRNL